MAHPHAHNVFEVAWCKYDTCVAWTSSRFSLDFFWGGLLMFSPRARPWDDYVETTPVPYLPPLILRPLPSSATSAPGMIRLVGASGVLQSLVVWFPPFLLPTPLGGWPVKLCPFTSSHGSRGAMAVRFGRDKR
eukprot:scaffold12568_cov35-Tisochrysis_lutea.AAC.4